MRRRSEQYRHFEGCCGSTYFRCLNEASTDALPRRVESRRFYCITSLAPLTQSWSMDGGGPYRAGAVGTTLDLNQQLNRKVFSYALHVDTGTSMIEDALLQSPLITSDGHIVLVTDDMVRVALWCLRISRARAEWSISCFHMRLLLSAFPAPPCRILRIWWTLRRSPPRFPRGHRSGTSITRDMPPSCSTEAWWRTRILYLLA